MLFIIAIYFHAGLTTGHEPVPKEGFHEIKSLGVIHQGCINGAGNETRTRDPDLGKVVLYQLSYSRLY
jgi:hypothetical protein